MNRKGSDKKEIKVGLDIGTRLIKAIEVSLDENKKNLLKFKFTEIEPASSPEKTTESLKALLKELNPTTKDLSISLSAPSAIVRFINMPKMKEEDLKNALRFEADKYIPFNINEVITDVSILGNAEDKNQMRVILAAAKKDVIDSRLSMLKQEGFSVSVIDIDSFACFNAFCNSFDNPDKSKNIVLLNMGYTQTNIIISKGDTPYFTRDIQIGTKEIAKAIAQEMEVDEKEADRFIFDPKDKSSQIFEAARSVLNTFIDELGLSFGYYENQYGASVDKVYLSGGVAHLEGITEFLEENLGVKPIIWNPFSKFEISPGVDKKSLEQVQSQFAVCVGLAIRK